MANHSSSFQIEQPLPTPENAELNVIFARNEENKDYVINHSLESNVGNEPYSRPRYDGVTTSTDSIKLSDIKKIGAAFLLFILIAIICELILSIKEAEIIPSSISSPNPKDSILKAHMGPSYNNDQFHPEGWVKIQFHYDNIAYMDTHEFSYLFVYNLTGVDPLCTNNCAVHIHEGRDCNDPVGPRYWNSDFFDDIINNNDSSPTSPMEESYYATNENNGHANGIFVVKHGNGYGPRENVNRTIVFHDSNGKHLACGVLLRYDEQNY